MLLGFVGKIRSAIVFAKRNFFERRCTNVRNLTNFDKIKQKNNKISQKFIDNKGGLRIFK
jgi:hypothetical protein